MKHRFYSLIYLLLSTFLFSCNHYYYGPLSNNVSLLREKGQVNLAGNLIITERPAGGEIKTAYAISKNIGIMLNGNILDGGETITNHTDIETSKLTQAEFGAGYFKELNKKVVFESYFGIGTGSSRNIYKSNEASKVSFTRYFIQPSLGFTNEVSTVKFALSTKLSAVHFIVKQSTVTGANSRHLNQLQRINAEPLAYFIDPAVLLQFGKNDLNFQMQVCNSLRLGGLYVKRPNFWFAAGLVYSITRD